MAKEKYTIEDVAKIHGKSKSAVYEDARLGRIRVKKRKRGKQTLYSFDPDLVEKSRGDGYEILYVDSEVTIEPSGDEKEELLDIPGDPQTIKKLN